MVALSAMDEQLLESSKKGDFRRAFEALAEGADPNCRDEGSYNWTPLHHCAREGDLRLGKALLARNADLNALDRFGQTPLHRAAFWGNLKFVQFLIVEGADFSIADYTSQRPEELAFYQNHMAIYQYFLQTKMRQKKKGEMVKKNESQLKQLQKELKRLDEMEAKVLKKESLLTQKIEELTNEILVYKSLQNWEGDKRVKSKLLKTDKEIGKQLEKKQKLESELAAIREKRAEKKAEKKEAEKSSLSINEMARSNSFKADQHRPSLVSNCSADEKQASWKNWD